MDLDLIDASYVPCQPPYWIIKYGNKIGLHIGTRRITKFCSSSSKTETMSHPIVAADNLLTPSKRGNISYDISKGKVWEDVELEKVAKLCETGTTLQWNDFIKILWFDHDYYPNRSESIKKLLIIQEILKYNKAQNLPSPGTYTIHLHTEPSGDNPEVVCSAREDVFALNVKWTEDPAMLKQRLVGDLREYAGILSPNRVARWWRMTYETNEERLQPLVALLNADPQAKSFKGFIMSGMIKFELQPTYETTDNESNINNSLQSSQYDKDNDKQNQKNSDVDYDTDVNYYAPKINLQQLLKQPWFEKFRKEKTYTKEWTDAFVSALMESEWKDTIAKDWAIQRKRNKRTQIKGHVIGLLVDYGVLKGSHDKIAEKIGLTHNTRTFSRYMSDGKAQPYADWVKEYITSHP